MSLRQKMVLIVITGILISAVLGTALIYELVQRKVLAHEIDNLQKVTAKFTSIAAQRFSECEPKLKNLARLLEVELSKPIQQNEIKSFHQLFEQNADGVWRSRKPNLNGQFEADIFLPPNAQENDAQKIQHLRIKRIMDIFGAAATKRSENVWYLSPNRSEVIFDKNYPDFVFEQQADNDYTQTPWVTYATPKLNPNRELRFTPSLFDPVPKVWMVSAVYPLYVNNEWIGSLGEDMPLTNVFEFMFQSDQLYSGTEHFLMDANGNFVLAGSWQKELEASIDKFKPNFEKEHALTTLFTQALTNTPKLLTDNLTFHGRRYIAIGMVLEPLNWRYYRLVPINQVMDSTRELFLNLLEMILFVGVINGFLVFTMTGKTITNRIKTLTESMNDYANDHGIRASNKVLGHDEIFKAALAFDEMANEIEINRIVLQESRNQYKTLVTNIPGITFRCALDADWTMLFMSGLVEELTGYPPSDFVANAVRTYTSIIYPDDIKFVNDEIQVSVIGNRPYTIEYRIVNRSGEIRWVHERGRCIKDKNGDIALLDGFIFDITDRYQMELYLKVSERKLGRINADLVQFTNIATHHLQEPTRRIVSFVQQLKNELSAVSDVSDDVRIPLQFIEQSAVRQRALVSDIQLYLAATQSTSAVESVSVTNILTKVLQHHAALIHKTEAKIEVGELPVLMMDRPRVYDIFNILLDNALNYRRLDCSPKIRIYGEDDGLRIRYYIEDNGIGIPTEYRERVFSVFERLQVNENQASTGIGLAIVRRILESCDGSVSLHETVGGGTTVIFDLPSGS